VDNDNDNDDNDDGNDDNDANVDDDEDRNPREPEVNCRKRIKCNLLKYFKFNQVGTHSMGTTSPDATALPAAQQAARK